MVNDVKLQMMKISIVPCTRGGQGVDKGKGRVSRLSVLSSHQILVTYK